MLRLSNPTLRMLSKSWPLLVAMTLLGAGLGLLFARTQRRIYQAKTLIEVDLRVQPVVGKAPGLREEGNMGYFGSREFYETQLRIITSDRVLGRVVRDVGLQHDRDFLADEDSVATVDDATEVLRRRTVVELVKGSRLLSIGFEDTDPKRASRLCESIANTYVSQNLEKTVAATSDAVIWLNGQVDHFSKVLHDSENALYAFKEDNKLPSTSINESSNMIRIEMEASTKALDDLRRRHDALAARHQQITGAVERVRKDHPRELPSSELLASGHLQFLRQRYEQALSERSELIGQNKGENHLDMQRAKRRATEAREAMIAELVSIREASARDLAAVGTQVASEEARLTGARGRAMQLNMKEIEYHRLERTRDQTEKLYVMLLERMKEADLARMMNVNEIRIVDLPIEPKKPIRPRVPLLIGVGTALGLLMGMAFAFLRELVDSTIKTQEDVEQRLSLTPLGLLPRMDAGEVAKQRRGRKERREKELPVELLVHSDPRGSFAETVRAVRTKILFMNPDHPYRSLLVTSAVPSEGKTTVACSIAIALAQGGERVCLVDCDLRRPKLHKVFGQPGDVGVTTVTVGEAKIEDVAKPTAIENLWCVTSGAIPPNPADLLQSERFKKFFAELSSRFDRLVIDSPPVAAVTDAAVLSTIVEGTILVIRSFRTTQALCKQGIRALQSVDAKIVGVVLNAVDFGSLEYKYYHYRKEGYGSPGSSDSKPEAAASAS